MNVVLNAGARELSKSFDQNQLCCGSLCEAIVVDGFVVLRCLACGLSWEKTSDGSFAPIAAYDSSRRRNGLNRSATEDEQLLG